MKRFSFKELVLPGIILFAICVVTATLLAFTNQLTAPKIEALAAENADAARKKVLTVAENFGDPLDITYEGQRYEYYEGYEKDGTTPAGYVFTTVTKGYGGDVKIMTGVDIDGIVSGIEILELSETPGLGMKAYENYFLTQFLGKDGSIAVVKNEAGNDSIVALTGATITSKAVTGAVNIALQLFDAVTLQNTPLDDSAAKADETARKVLLPTADSFESLTTTSLSGEEQDYYMGKDTAGTAVGYIFETDVTGYNGIVLVRTAVDAQGVITGVKVLSILDTSSADSSVDGDTFTDQFIGKSGKVVSTNAAVTENAVQVITGATVSSNAVVNAVNEALDLYNSLTGGTP